MAAEATRAALHDGPDVIYQGTFFDGTWVGYADFLLRVERPSNLGAWSYEVADTKLARKAKAGADPPDLLVRRPARARPGRDAGAAPRRARWERPRRSIHYRVADFMAYYRRVKAEFESAVAAGEAVYPVTETYPDPVEHCDVCRWNLHCRAQRRGDDDLSLVAGITSRQRRGLKDQAVAQRRQLAVLDLPPAPADRGHQRSGARAGSGAGTAPGRGARMKAGSKWELLEPELDGGGGLVADRGFLVLPEPSVHDLFFDIEGDPFALDDGVEYLFGVLEPGLDDPSRPGAPMFHEIWSRDDRGNVTRAAEKAAFEQLVDLLIDRLDADPLLHIYHYAPYERSALARLAQRHATREEEVDRLLTRARPRRPLPRRPAGRPGQRRELLDQAAGTAVRARARGGAAERRLQHRGVRGVARRQRGRERRGRRGHPPNDRRVQPRRRPEQLAVARLARGSSRGPGSGSSASPSRGRPIHPEAEEPAKLTDTQRRIAELVAALTADVPDEPAERTDEQAGRWLLAQLLEWHRREDRAFWWRFFDLAGLTDEELVDEREPLGKIELIEDLGVVNKSGTRHQTLPVPAPGPRVEEGPGGGEPGNGRAGRLEALRRGPRARRDQPRRHPQADARPHGAGPAEGADPARALPDRRHHGVAHPDGRVGPRATASTRTATTARVATCCSERRRARRACRGRCACPMRSRSTQPSGSGSRWPAGRSRSRDPPGAARPTRRPG